MAILIDDSDSVLVVVDAQPGFLRKLDPAVAARLTERIAWLVQVANALGVPIVVTEEESDVCVAQSALGLVELGWTVAVVSDAVGSPGPAHQQGLDRIGAAGVTLIGLKGLYYEWIRRVDRLGEVGHLHEIPPAGITL